MSLISSKLGKHMLLFVDKISSVNGDEVFDLYIPLVGLIITPCLLHLYSIAYLEVVIVLGWLMALHVNEG